MADFRIERSVIRKGFRAIAGLDEAGRGALFGPVVAAAVVFPCSLILERKRGWLKEVDDSKRLAPRKRERLARAILASASSVGVGFVPPHEIDRINIYRASLEAMRKAIRNMPAPPEFLLVDGFEIDGVDYPQRRVPQGDRKSLSIAAASIIAKVFRDDLMRHFDQIYKGYALSKNKGYGTKEHYKALERMGPSAFHRKTFNLGNRKRS